MASDSHSPVFPSQTTSSLAVESHQSALPFLSFLGQQLASWQIHRCQLTSGLISQHEPMKLIYHYEQLNDEIKAKLPLNGQLLANFDKVMSREHFAQLGGLEPTQVASPWQLKFVGKLVVFFDQPEIAMRLHWTNTLKPFEIIAVKSLESAIEKSFDNWQFIDDVEIISKTPNVVLTAEHPDLPQAWQQSVSQGFLPVPSVLSLTIQQFLHEQSVVKEVWVAYMMDIAKQHGQTWLEQQSLIV